MPDRRPPRRKHTRLQGFDYSSPLYYFITACTKDRKQLFGSVEDGALASNAAGRMLEAQWNALPVRYNWLEVLDFVAMPNHVHGILHIVPVEGRAPEAASISTVMSAYKSLTTLEYIRGVGQHGWEKFNAKLWQRSFHDHIIRDEEGYGRIREYIEMNPLRWHLDRENEDATDMDPFYAWLDTQSSASIREVD